jgi:preprotein translocase subunit Sec63
MSRSSLTLRVDLDRVIAAATEFLRILGTRDREAPVAHVTLLDPYSILGLEPKTGLQEVRARYRHLVKILHPDRGGDRALFDLVTKAYKQIEGRSRSTTPS